MTICRAEVDEMRFHGTCQVWFYDLWVDTFEEWPLDTAAVEGKNNMVKHHIKVAAGIGWKLLSRRLISRSRVINVQPHEFDDFVQSCVAHHAQTLAAMTPEKEKALFAVVGDDEEDDSGGEEQVHTEPRSDGCCVPDPHPDETKPFRNHAARCHIAIVDELQSSGRELVASMDTAFKIYSTETTIQSFTTAPAGS